MKLEPHRPAAQPKAPETGADARLAAPSDAGPGFEADTFRPTARAKSSEPLGLLGEVAATVASVLGEAAGADDQPKVRQARNWGKKNPMPATPRGQATILSANMREGLVVDPGDVAHTRDMKNFVNRLVKQVPYAPDVLTLNEVVGPSAENVARLLSARTGCRYEVVQAPGPTPFTPGPITRDTAVLVNTETFKVEQRGFIRTTTPKGTNMPAYARLKQKGSQLRLNVASVHLPAPSAWGLSPEETNKWRLSMGRQVNAFLERTDRGRRTINVMAGDFNNKRARRGEETPLYQAVTDRWGYKDSLLEQRPEHVDRDRIDYIFAQGRVVDAGKDHTYTREMIDSGFRNDGAKDPATGDKREKKNPKRYYSDHPFEWAVLGKPKKEG